MAPHDAQEDGGVSAQARLDPANMPDWPRLMRESLAAAYLGIGASTLREHGPKPRKFGSRTLYDRRDLDRWADALDGQPLDQPEREAEADDVAARVAARIGAQTRA